MPRPDWNRPALVARPVRGRTAVALHLFAPYLFAFPLCLLHALLLLAPCVFALALTAFAISLLALGLLSLALSLLVPLALAFLVVAVVAFQLFAQVVLPAQGGLPVLLLAPVLLALALAFGIGLRAHAVHVHAPLGIFLEGGIFACGAVLLLDAQQVVGTPRVCAPRRTGIVVLPQGMVGECGLRIGLRGAMACPQLLPAAFQRFFVEPLVAQYLFRRRAYLDLACGLATVAQTVGVGDLAGACISTARHLGLRAQAPTGQNQAAEGG